MAKILSKSGDSLADVYDVQGSIAGMDDLKSEEVNLVHEMGGTIFSERLSAAIFPLTTGAIAQSIAFNTGLLLPQTSRLLGLSVVSNNPGRLVDVSVHITAPLTELPVFAWVNADGQISVRMLISGSVATNFLLRPGSVLQVPNLFIGEDSPLPASTITIRGNTSAFGAGTVTTQAIAYIAFPQIGGLSNRGLPIPSW